MKLPIPAKLIPLARHLRSGRYRHIVIRGGRGSGKSWSIGRVLVANTLAADLRVLCLRETQKSIKESSLRLLDDQIQALGFGPAYDVQNTQILCRRNRSEFQFTGLREHTSDSIKSYEGFDVAWIEEAHAVKAKSANVLIPTLRKPGSVLVWSYNPDAEDDYVHQLAGSGRDDVLVIECNYSDNRWFPKELDAERLALKAINDDLYKHVWEGHCRSVAGLLFKRTWFNFYDVLPARLNYYITTDYAGGLDPDNPDSDPDETSIGVWGVTSDGDLYLLDHWAGQSDTSEAINVWLGFVAKYKPLRAFDEKGPILRAIDPFIRRAMRSRRIFVSRESLASAGSKADRALGFAALASAGCVYLPKNASGQKVLNQLCAFNGQDGRPDDDVDMCSLMARGLDFMANAGKMSGTSAKLPDDYGMNDDETDSWKVA